MIQKLKQKVRRPSVEERAVRSIMRRIERDVRIPLMPGLTKDRWRIVGMQQEMGTGWGGAETRITVEMRRVR